MKVKELVALLKKADKEAAVVIALDGSSFPVAPAEETSDYNFDGELNEFYIVADKWK